MNLKSIATTLAILGSGVLTLSGCDKDKPATEVPATPEAAGEKGEGTCGGDKKAEGNCGGDKAEGSCGGDKADGHKEGAEGSCGGDHKKGEGSCGGDKAAE